MSVGDAHQFFLGRFLRVLCVYFEHQWRVQFERCVAKPLQTIAAPSQCASRRVERSDEGLSDLRDEGIRGRFHSLHEREEKEFAGIAEKVLRAVTREVEEKGLKLSISEGGEELKNKVVASCNFLEADCSQREGVGPATSAETPGVDLRTRTKQLGAKVKARRKSAM